jgi:hypothetical protein
MGITQQHAIVIIKANLYGQCTRAFIDRSPRERVSSAVKPCILTILLHSNYAAIGAGNRSLLRWNWTGQLAR